MDTCGQGIAVSMAVFSMVVYETWKCMTQMHFRWLGNLVSYDVVVLSIDYHLWK